MSGILDMKKEYLTDDEIKDYYASLKRISELQNEIYSREIIIDQLREGITTANLLMSKRHHNFMMNKKTEAHEIL